ncbi:uncharacterized protein LOC110080559 isoform X3 [Pogona vitticeps]
MYPRRRHGHWFLQTLYQVNASRGMFGIHHSTTLSQFGQVCAGSRTIPNNRVYNGIFDNYRNSNRGHVSKCPRGYFHDKHRYRGRSFRGFQNNFSKGSSQKLPHSSSYDKSNKRQDGSQKVETLSAEPKEAEQGKEVSLWNRTYSPKDELKPDSQATGVDKPLCSALAVSPSSWGTLESLTSCRNETEIDLSQTKQVEEKATPVAEEPPEQIAPFPSATVPAEERSLSETTERLLSVEEKDSPLLDVSHSPEHSCHVKSPLAVEEVPFQCEMANEHHQSEEKEAELVISSCLLLMLETKIAGYCENSDHGQGGCASTVNSVKNQHTLSNIHCVPVLVRDARNKLPWETADDLRGWAPEDCQDPPWTVNQAGKCDNISEHNRELFCCQVPSGPLSHTHLSCDQKNENGRLLECHCSSPKSHFSSGSEHSSRNYVSKKFGPENSRPSCQKRCHSRSPRRQEHSSVSPHRQEHGSGYSHLPKLSSQDQSSPHRRKGDSHGTSHCCFCLCQQCCSQSQKNSWDSFPHCFGNIKGHRSPQERRKVYKVPQDHPPESPIITNFQKREEKKETEHEKPAKKKKATLEKSMKSTKESSKAIISPSEFSFRLPDCSAPLQKKQEVLPKIKKETESPEKQTTQDHVLVGHTEASTLPEAAQNLPLVLRPELLQKAAKSENTCSPHQPSAGEKTNSSTMPWTPKDRSAAVLARKEAIEEAYLQVLLNFAGVATMLVEKAPCMQEAMDSALRANLRRIGDYYGCMLSNYIDSLAETS